MAIVVREYVEHLGNSPFRDCRYRLYFGKSGQTLVLLRLGGDKRSQTKDIERAKGCWVSYTKESTHGKTK